MAIYQVKYLHHCEEEASPCNNWFQLYYNAILLQSCIILYTVVTNFCALEFFIAGWGFEYNSEFKFTRNQFYQMSVAEFFVAPSIMLKFGCVWLWIYLISIILFILYYSIYITLLYLLYYLRCYWYHALTGITIGTCFGSLQGLPNADDGDDRNLISTTTTHYTHRPAYPMSQQRPYPPWVIPSTSFSPS